MATTRVYRSGVLEASEFSLDQISDYLAQPDCVVWVDVCHPDQAELAQVSKELKLHPLAVEDATHLWQRPKLDRYDTHLFLAAYAVHLERETGQLSTTQVTAFITRNALVTVRAGDEYSMDGVLARWDSSPDLTALGVGRLLHGLLDDLVDTHFDAVNILDDEIESLEDILFDEHPRDQEVQRRSFELRKSLVRLRRIVLPMREVVNTLLRRDLHVMNDQIGPYFQDVYDHVLRVTEWTESLRDLVTTILETNLTVQGNRLNVIMKKVTSWAAIIAVPTAVTGFYGQNVPFPGEGHAWGMWMSLGISSSAALSLYAIFKTRDWI